jgi:hypothetical protein
LRRDGQQITVSMENLVDEVINQLVSTSE